MGLFKNKLVLTDKALEFFFFFQNWAFFQGCIPWKLLELGSWNFHGFHTPMIRPNNENFIRICWGHHGTFPNFGSLGMGWPK